MNAHTLQPVRLRGLQLRAMPPLQAVAWIDLDKSVLCPRPKTRIFAGAEYVVFILPMP